MRRASLLGLLIMAVALPASSMNRPSGSGEAADDPPAPSMGQRALIEAHDTTGVGWWSSPAINIAPGCDPGWENAQSSDALPDAQAPLAAGAYPRRTRGVEIR